MFDDPNLVSAAGLVPAVKLATGAGLAVLADRHLSVPTDKGANAGGKVTALVAGMVAGADSIDDMALLRHGAMGRVFDRAYAPSTLGSFLRAFTFGHVRQLDAVASRFWSRWPTGPRWSRPSTDAPVLVDVDDTIIEVHGHAKQGAGFGYSRVRGLNALVATAATGSARRWSWPNGCARAPAAHPAERPGWSPTPSRPWPGWRPGGRCWSGPTRRSMAAHHRRRPTGRRPGVGHRPARSQGQEGNRRDRRRRVDPDPVHRRHPR